MSFRSWRFESSLAHQNIMKNLLAIIIGLSLSAFLSGCTFFSSDGDQDFSDPVLENTREPLEDSKVIEDSDDFKSMSLQIVDIGSYASCFSVELQDADAAAIEVPEEIKESFDCVTGAVGLSNTNEYLLYDHYNQETKNIDLMLYHILSDSSVWLMSFLGSLDGLSCEWNEADTHIACVVVNQEEYSGNTKIFILQTKDGKLVEKKIYPQEYESMVSYTCGASCYPGEFWFEGENTLKYYGHDMVSPGEIFSIEF